MCFAPQRRAIFRHLNFKKWSGADVFCTFSLENVLLATAACNFSTSQLQKSAPILRCFVHFHLKMCFSPQRRAIFQHLNFKKCSEPLSFLACSLQNVLLATAACNFWFLLWPHDSAPAALTSLLFDSPDTRIIEKTQHFATSLTFGAGVSSFFWLSRYCIFFLLTLLHLLTLLSFDFTSSICFSSAFQLSILSEVYYLNFLRLYIYVCVYDVYVPYHIHTKYCINPLSFCDTGLPNNSFAKTHASPTWPRLALGQVVIIPQKNRGGRDPLDDQSVGLSKRVRIQKSGI